MWRAGLFFVIVGSACAPEAPRERESRRERPTDAPEARRERTLESEWLRQDNDRLRREVEELRAEVAGLRSNLEQANASLDYYLRSLNYYWQRYGVVYPEPRPSVDGRILAVREHDLEISLGAEDGVRQGDLFVLRRGADYVGMVAVTRVQGDKAFALVEDRGKAFPPREGDVVYPYVSGSK